MPRVVEDGVLYTKSYSFGVKEVYVIDKAPSLKDLPSDKLARETNEKKNLIDSVNRARKTVFDVAVSNTWDWFVTLTFAVERTNYADKYDLIRNELHQIKRYNKDFKFIFIAEAHKKVEKNGLHAIHFHGLISGLPDEELCNRAVNKLGVIYNWRRMNEYGFNSMSAVRNQEACGAYLQKYMTKSLLKPSFHKSMYVLSRGLYRPLRHKYRIKGYLLPEVKRMLRALSCDIFVTWVGVSYTLSNCNLSDNEIFRGYGLIEEMG